MTYVRAPRPSDTAAVVDLEHTCFGAQAWTPDAVGESLTPGQHRWARVAEQDSHVVGYVIAVPAGDVLDLARIAVTPAARGRGIGRQLVQTLGVHADEAGYQRVLLEVAADNISAARLYERCGFAVIDRRVAYYPDGADALVMSAPCTRGGGNGD